MSSLAERLRNAVPEGVIPTVIMGNVVNLPWPKSLRRPSDADHPRRHHPHRQLREYKHYLEGG